MKISKSHSSTSFTGLLIIHRCKSLLFVSMFLCTAHFAYGSMYYVDPARGTDNGTGSPSSPFKSVGQAQALAQPGDSVVLRSGSYGEFTDSVQHASYITYKAENESVDAKFTTINLKSSAFVRFEGIIADSFNAYESRNVELISSIIRFPGDRYSAPANLVDIRRATNPLVRGCIITHGKTGIKGDGSVNAVISGNNIYDLAVDGMTTTPASNIIIENNHIHDLKQDRVILKDLWTNLDFKAGSTAITLQNIPRGILSINAQSAFSTGVMACLNFGSPRNFANITTMGFSIKSSAAFAPGQLVVRISDTINGGTSGVYTDIPVFACTAGVTSKANISKLNLLYNVNSMTKVRSVSLLRQVNSGPGTINVNEWTFSNGAHQDFIVISGSDIIIRGNICHGGASQGIFTSPADAANVTIEDNLIYDMAGTTLTNISLRGNCNIRNNTFVGYLRPGNENLEHSPHHFSGNVGIIALDGGAGFKIQNNIVAGELSSIGAVNNNNIVQRQVTPGPQTIVISGPNGSAYTFKGSIFADAKFTRNHNDIVDFRLAPSSPAINFGDAHNQPKQSLGSLDADGFVINNGPERSSKRNSAGAKEPGVKASAALNRPPDFGPLKDRVVTAGNMLAFSVEARDPGGKPVAVNAANLPQGAKFTSNRFEWTPSNNQAGSYSIGFYASSGRQFTFQTLHIEVLNVNRPPVLKCIQNKTTSAGVLMFLRLEISDPDNDALTCTVTGLPHGARFDRNEFTWIPGFDQVGRHEVIFFVSDTKLQYSQKVLFYVKPILN